MMMFRSRLARTLSTSRTLSTQPLARTLSTSRTLSTNPAWPLAGKTIVPSEGQEEWDCASRAASSRVCGRRLLLRTAPPLLAQLLVALS